MTRVNTFVFSLFVCTIKKKKKEVKNEQWQYPTLCERYAGKGSKPFAAGEAVFSKEITVPEM